MTFNATVAGKTVAVVGPAPPVGDQGPEIDAHDLVVRFAWFGDPPIPGSGTRTDISYYNAALGRDVIAGKRSIPPLRWACFKATSMQLLEPNWRHASACQPRVRNPNMVPLSTHDLLAAGAARVKVFCADFYLSAEPYGDDPNKHRSSGIPADAGLQEIMTSTLRCHDQLAQRRFMRTLLGLHPNLTGDERFLRVLALDDAEYRRRLSELWVGTERLRQWRHTGTGRVRRVRTGSSLDRTFERRPEWVEVTA